MNVDRLDVLLGSVLVGHLARGSDARTTFFMTEGYRRMPRRPVLGQFFEDDLERRYQGKPGELPAFFANLVAEGILREAVERQAGIPEGDDFAFLAFAGGDLPGAVLLRPGQGTPAEGALAAAEDEEAGPPSRPPESGGEFSFSLAGAQLKFSMVRDKDWLTLPARDRTGQWIAKIAGPRWAGLPENEYSMLEWARAAGFDVPECHLHDTARMRGLPAGYVDPGARALVIQRHDRAGERRIHQEDFAQAVGLLPARKLDHLTYAQMGRLVKAFVGAGAFDELVRRLVLVLACGNADAHLKNWSLVYPDGVSARLSPLYDQVSTVAWPDIGRRLALKVARRKNFAQIDEAEMSAMAEMCEEDAARVAEVIRETLDRLAEAWRVRAGELPMPAAHRRALHEHWGRVPLLRRYGFDKLGQAVPSRRPRRARRAE